MGSVRKVRCPNPQCRQINIIDIEAELKKQGCYAVFRTAVSIDAEIELPETIVVVCSNPACRKKFKVKL